jgi:hypothetical protein
MVETRHEPATAIDSEPANPSVAFEPSDASVRGLFFAGATLCAVCVSSSLVVLAVFNLLAARSAGLPVGQTATSFVPARYPAGPQLEGIESSAAERQAKVDAAHAGYGWVDRDKKIVRVPIVEAMKLLPSRLSSAPAPPPEKSPEEKRLAAERTNPPGPSASGRIIDTSPKR